MVNNITKWKILGLYLENYNSKYYLRELANLLKKPHQSLTPYLNALVKENILIREKRKAITEFSLNRKNPQLQDYLVIAEKERAIEKLKEPLLRILYEKIHPYFTKNIFVIFGSATKNLKEAADIDLLLIGPASIKKEVEDFEEIYDKKIHVITTKSIKEIDNGLLQEIIKKHVILNNTEYILNYFNEKQ